MTVRLHRVTVAQFARMLILEAKRRRRNYRCRRDGSGNGHVVGEVAGVSHVLIWCYETGKYRPNLMRVLSFLEATPL